jgi:hypothetical protein
MTCLKFPVYVPLSVRPTFLGCRRATPNDRARACKTSGVEAFSVTSSRSATVCR